MPEPADDTRQPGPGDGLNFPRGVSASVISRSPEDERAPRGGGATTSHGPPADDRASRGQGSELPLADEVQRAFSVGGWWKEHPAYSALVDAFRGSTQQPEHLAFLALTYLRHRGWDVTPSPGESGHCQDDAEPFDSSKVGVPPDRLGLPSLGYVRGYFAGWSDHKKGRGHGHSAPLVDVVCGVVAPNQGPNGEPLACAWPEGHLPDAPHSWAWVPTVYSGGTPT